MSLYAASYMTYAEYLETEHWQEKRLEALERAGHRCQVCGTDQAPLEVHHNSYEHLFDEDPEDLCVLCDECHELFTKAGRIPVRR